jgi:hypothetical protein
MAALKRFETGADGDSLTVGGNLIVSGTVTAANTATLGNIDVNGGTIDGAVIGGASAAAGSFTTLNTSGAVVFNDAGADVDFRVEGDTNANLIVADAGVDKVGIGTNTFNTNGGVLQVSNGISFPATQSACADANTLDDYEEGTWTPVLTFATPGTVSVGYQNREAFYTKIGRFVYFSCFIQLNAFTKGTASGNLRVSGLPFTAQNPGNNEIPINWAVYDTPLPTSAGQFPTPLIPDNVTFVDLSYASNNTVNVTWPDPDSSSQYKLSGCYQV